METGTRAMVIMETGMEILIQEMAITVMRMETTTGNLLSVGGQQEITRGK